MDNLTLEEQGLLDSFEQEEWVSHSHVEKRKKELQEYANNTLQSSVSMLSLETEIKRTTYENSF